MQAVILAGGLGQRLRPAVQDRPKPMADAGGKPFLAYQMEWLRRHGITELVLCVGYLAEHIRDYFQDGQAWGMRIRYAVERELLGTAGALRNAEEYIQGTFVVMNGDSFLDLDLPDLLRFHRQKRARQPATLGTLALVEIADATRYGSVTLDETGRIVRFVEKSEAPAGACLINAGLYVLEPEVLRFIPSGQKVSIERETFPLILREGGWLFGYLADAFFVDIGTPEGYARFRAWVSDLPV